MVAPIFPLFKWRWHQSLTKEMVCNKERIGYLLIILRVAAKLLILQMSEALARPIFNFWICSNLWFSRILKFVVATTPIILNSVRKGKVGPFYSTKLTNYYGTRIDYVKQYNEWSVWKDCLINCYILSKAVAQAFLIQLHPFCICGKMCISKSTTSTAITANDPGPIHRIYRPTHVKKSIK